MPFYRKKSNFDLGKRIVTPIIKKYKKYYDEFVNKNHKKSPSYENIFTQK